MAEPRPADSPRLIVLHPLDTVAVALAPLHPGTPVTASRAADDIRLVASSLIPFGHKIAILPMAAGEPVIKYGEVIGIVTVSIKSGEHVHVHNVRSDRAGADRG